MKLELPYITSSKLLLRLATKGDVPKIIEYFSKNKAHLAPWQPLWRSNFLTSEFWQEEVKVNIKEFQGDRSLKLFVFRKTNPTKELINC